MAHGASDLVLVADAPPTVFSRGQWMPLEEATFTPAAISEALTGIMSPAHRDTFERQKDVDFALELAGAGRYRVNLHSQRGTLAAAFRAIPPEVPSFESLNLPPAVLSFAEYPSGLVMITGGTGQGKSTTVAAFIEHMNRTRRGHIITIEDPIEFAFTHGTCVIEQREIGIDSPSFASALRHVLRQRPDVIVIGEMRDLETISTALTAAETGHLVLATLHTASAAQTLARIIDVFPPEQQGQVRLQLAASLRGIVCQALCRDAAEEGLVPATEILVATTAIRRAIRENETHLVYAMLETGRRQGMHTMEQSLTRLVEEGHLGAEAAIAAAPEPGRLQTALSGAHVQ
jgi:twitching motility protein PilT